jgi:hypothetical protein
LRAVTGLAERVERVRVLLETLHDPYPSPRGLLEPDSGPAASRYVPCQTCGRRGEIRVRGAWRLCLICDGAGWKRRSAGDEPWDAYLSLPLREAAELPRESRARQRPAESLEDTFPWERARAVYDRHGSYAQLRIGLAWLQTETPRRHALVRAVHVDHEPIALGPAARRELELGLVQLTLRLGRVRVPPWLIEEPTAKRRTETIAELAAQGETPGTIARRLGVSKRVVQRQLRAHLHGHGGGAVRPAR